MNLTSCHPSLPLLTSLLTLLFLNGCEKAQIEEYTVEEESTEEVEEPAPGAGATPQSGGDQSVSLLWEAPESWVEKSPGSMRLASFQVGENGDLSVTRLGGRAGGMIPNINRWREQLELEPLSGARMADSIENITIDGRPAAYVEMTGTGTGQMSRPGAPQPEPPAGGGMNMILGAILELGGDTWFFKLTGPEEAMRPRIPEFRTFLDSVKVQGGNTPAPSQPAVSTPDTTAPSPAAEGVEPSDTPAQAPTAADMDPNQVMPNAVAAKDPEAATALQYETPDGWERQPPKPMRAVSFTLSGHTSNEIEVSVIPLSGQSGSLVANVNRWRRQIGLGPLPDDPNQNATLGDVLATENHVFRLIDLLNVTNAAGDEAEKAILAAIAEQGDVTWFIKMTGDRELVAANEKAFTQFVSTLQLPN